MKIVLYNNMKLLKLKKQYNKKKKIMKNMNTTWSQKMNKYKNK